MLSALAGSAGCASTSPPSAATPASDPARTAATSDDLLSRGGASLFVVHLMSDFDAFKKYFEEGTAARTKAGIQGHLLSRLDDGRVVVHLFADDAAKVEQELASPELEKYLDRKGSPESSLVWVTQNELVKAPRTPPTAQTYSLFLKVHVTDFAALAQGFERDLPLFAEHDVIAEGLHRSTRKDDIAILHFVGTSREKLDALPKRPEFIQLLSSAGSKDELKPLVGIDLLRSRPALAASAQ